MRRRTGDWAIAARAERYGIALAKLKRVYAAWKREEAEMIDVVEAAGALVDADQ